MVTNELRISQLKNSTHKQRYFYSTLSLWSNLLNNLTKYKLATLPINTLIDTTGDIILGFYKIEDTVPLLQQELGLDPKTAALLGAEVLEFLAPLSDPNWQPPSTDEESIDIEVETAAPTINIPVKAPAFYADAPDTVVMPTSHNPIPTSPSTPRAAEVFAPAPTTADIKPQPSYTPTPTPSYNPTPEPTYQSSQPISAAPLSNTPSYSIPKIPAPSVPTPPAPDRPRWSTEI